MIMIQHRWSFTMFKALIPLTLVPLLAFAQPAEARRLFWWQMIGPNGEINQPSQYDPMLDPQFDNSDPYADDLPDDQAAQDMFNQREYELYKREMRKRRALDANYDPQFGYPEPPRYQIPPRVIHKKKPVAQKPITVPQIAVTKPIYKPPVMATGPVVQQIKPVKTASLSGISCSKGSGIVSSFGFSNVSTKSCSGDTLVYGASRGGKSFEVEVSAASGELTAVKKL
jgi:hypothetical protein